MANNFVDMVVDLGMSAQDLNGSRDVTHFFREADLACKNSNGAKKIVKMPTGTASNPVRLLVSTQHGGDDGNGSPTVFTPHYARDWVSDQPDTTIMTLDKVTTTQRDGPVLTMMEYSNFGSDSVAPRLAFTMDAQADFQMGGIGNGDGNWFTDTSPNWLPAPNTPSGAHHQGDLKGFACNGVDAHAGVKNLVANMKYLNFRSRSATGYGSAFCMQMIKTQGGVYYVEFDVTDGSIGSECLVFHGATFSGGDPWKIAHLRSNNMWRGWGCFNGGKGEVHDLVATNCLGVSDYKAPSHRVSGNVSNIEAGTDVGGQAGGTPGPIKIFGAKSVNCDKFLVIANNYGNQVGRVEVLPENGSTFGGLSQKDGNCIVFSTDANNPKTMSDGLYCTDVFFDRPDGAILSGGDSQTAKANFAACTYQFPPGRIGRSPTPSGLTAGSGSTNNPPVLTAMVPADGATVTAGSTVTVACKATDDSDSF